MKKDNSILPISLFVQGSISFAVFLQNQNPQTFGTNGSYMLRREADFRFLQIPSKDGPTWQFCEHIPCYVCGGDFLIGQ